MNFISFDMTCYVIFIKYIHFFIHALTLYARVIYYIAFAKTDSQVQQKNHETASQFFNLSPTTVQLYHLQGCINPRLAMDKYVNSKFSLERD